MLRYSYERQEVNQSKIKQKKRERAQESFILYVYCYIRNNNPPFDPSN